jgi:hypothetical protein
MKDIVLRLLALTCSFVILASGAPQSACAQIVNPEGMTTHERYGKNIVYFNFSEIPINGLSSEKIDLSADLKKRLKDYDPVIDDTRQFEHDFWGEANKIGYTACLLGSMNIKEVISAIVEIVVSRLSYAYVDTDTVFTKKFGKHLPADRYFHLGLGDCDKYRDVVIAAFKIVKALNPGLKNTYVSAQYLGGNVETHAWNSVIILDDDRIILSHIDPQRYDLYGRLEAVYPYITLAHDFYRVKFFEEIGRYSGYSPALNICLGILTETTDRKLQEAVLTEMGLIASLMFSQNPEESISRITWIIDQCQARGFAEHTDSLLYHSYKIHEEAGNKAKALRFKTELFRDHPDSAWVRYWSD